ncbi:hypothetical protein T484DRAFT_3600362 [Baffinella frigidus]|nr:hypothetical protein T484DRAFT_3600362 [Cryptophyta sp. CCMP2293]
MDAQHLDDMRMGGMDSDSDLDQSSHSREEYGYFGSVRRGISAHMRRDDEEQGGSRRLFALRVLSRASADTVLSQLEMVQARLDAAGNGTEDWVFRLIYVAVGCACLRAIIWHSQEFCTGVEGVAGGVGVNPFVGEYGMVVMWLKVEAVTALGLPTFNMMVRMTGLTRGVAAWYESRHLIDRISQTVHLRDFRYKSWCFKP